MDKGYRTGAMAAALVLGGGFDLAAGPARAAEAEAPRLGRVLMSTGGVAYFEYRATVSGRQELPFSVRRDQLDDVLKSLVVHDAAGAVAGLRLVGELTLEERFRDLPIPVAALESEAGLLAHLKGAVVSAKGSRSLQGRLLAVTPERQVVGGDAPVTLERHRVSLATPEGIESFLLEEAGGVEIEDAALRAQIGQALDALAEARRLDRRELVLSLAGEGKREVRFGYVVEAPLWKASYRLTLPAADGAKPGPKPGAEKGGLQGWAVVENLGGTDWKSVDLTLVSGNPVTFRQALASPFRVQRPSVPVEVFGRVLPPLDEGETRPLPAPKAERARMMPPMLPAPSPSMMMADMAAGYGGGGGEVPAPPPAPMEAAAESEEAATQVLFRFPKLIEVAAGQSVLLPMVSRDLPVRRVYLYRQATHARHPLAAVELKNDGDAGLPPGVLTLYEQGKDGGAFVGDARLGPVAPGDTRLVSFAVDEKTLVESTLESSGRISRLALADGALRLTLTWIETTRYRLVPPAGETRLVILEHPRQPGTSLVPDSSVKVGETPGAWRIEVALAAGESRDVAVTVERPGEEVIGFDELSPDRLAMYLSGWDLSPAHRAALDKAVQLGAAVDAARQAIDQRQEHRTQIVADQERLRHNLGSVPKDSDLHKRYLGMLGRQEDELAAIDGDRDGLRKALAAARAALKDYLAQLK